MEIAGYQIGRLLGKGNFGETYEAVTTAGGRVALKLIKEEAVAQGFDGQRFQREVRALQKAAGPHVVRFVDAGAGQLGNETRYYVALEYLQGEDLAALLKRSKYKLEEETLRRLLYGVVSGLKTVHDQNIVHRDLKPANIFVTSSGEAKLLDFGLVKMLDYTTLTVMPGQAIGTPLYIAPEILRGQSVDYRADFYSLGVLMYHLFTEGKYPFDATTPYELYAKVVNDPPTPPTRYNPALASELENLILVLLSKQPYERTFNHSELASALQVTPITVTPQHYPAVQPSQVYQKQCLFRVMHTEKSHVERFIEAGGHIEGIEYQASYLPRFKNTLNAYHDMGISYLFDPVAYRFAYSSFAQTEGVVNLPYLPDANNVLEPAALQSLAALQTYAHGAIDWQTKWDCSIFVAPFHFCRDLSSPWVDIDIKLIEESLGYARTVSSGTPMYAGLCLNIEAYTIEANRVALLNRYSRSRADGYMFYVDAIEERTSNVLQLRALVELLRLFQRLGKPVFACRTGTLGLGLLAAGADGVTTGIGSLSGFSESTLLVNRAVGFDMEAKYYIPEMLLTLPISMARDILSDPRNAELRCSCPFCQTGVGNIEQMAKAHFLHVRSAEVAELNTMQDTQERLQWFSERVDSAIGTCDRIRQTVALRPHHFSHLKAWQQAFRP